jgi:hypothetical protein
MIYEGSPFEKLANPVYDYDGEAIIVDAWFKEEPEVKSKYVFRENDVTPYAGYFYNEIANGALGEVGQLVVTDELLEKEIKIKRNFLLVESDWSQLPDVSEEVSSLWKEYRQALRDITKQEGYPKVVVWPEKPV